MREAGETTEDGRWETGVENRESGDGETGDTERGATRGDPQPPKCREFPTYLVASLDTESLKNHRVTRNFLSSLHGRGDKLT